MKTNFLPWTLVLVTNLLIAVGCAESVDPYERASIVITCRPGDSIALAIWRPDAPSGAPVMIRDTINVAKRYDGLKISTWEVITMRLDTTWWDGVRWVFDLKAGQVDTADT